MATVKRTLETKLKEITEARWWRDSIAVKPTADPLDTTQQALEREMATRELDRNAILAHHIRAALDRVDRENYGTCLECEEPISPKRLAAIPWAALCIGCQERADRAHRRVDDWLGDGIRSAA